MYRLQMLGGISLTNEAGAEVDALLRQSKHVAVLAYLSSPKPGTWHKRDSVLGTFWAENDQARARSAFRSALYTLRGHLPENAILSRGDNDLSVNPQIITTDVAAMSDLLLRGEYARALACYKGEFLPGIYVDAENFDQWLESERRRTRAIASEAAKRLSEQLEARNDDTGAIRAAKRNYELAPDDEGSARRLITLLDQAGDRAQAFAVYEQFRNHVYEAFGIRPSAETVALLDSIRTRHEPTHIPASTHSRAAALPERDAQPVKRRNTRALALLAIPAAVAAIAWTVWPREKTAGPGLGRTMVVLSATNETGDQSLDYLASGIAEDLANQLRENGGFDIRSAARSTWPKNVRNDLRGISRAYNASFILRSSLRKLEDSLQITASVIDAGTLTEEPIGTRSFSQSSISDVVSGVAAEISGTVFRRPLLSSQARPVDPESYRLTLQGFHQLLGNVKVTRGLGPRLNTPSAMDLFLQAVHADPSNARAYSGISSVLSSRIVSDQIPFEQGFEQASAAAQKAIALDSAQGTALANLGFLRSIKFRKLSAGEPLIRRAEAVEPSNPEVYLVKSVMYRNAHMWEKGRDAIRVAHKLDPLSPLYFDREGLMEFCAGRPARALALYLAEPVLDPTDGVVQGGITRALAMLGRYDEAIESWRTDARMQSDTVVLHFLQNAHGKAGYWNARHAIGRIRLAALKKETGRISRVQVMRANLAAGDSAKGFELMEQMVNQRVNAIYRLPCMSDIDEYRDTPRFKSIVAKAGALPP